ncbi:ABC-type Fe3+-siderophore transport system, permease 2 component [Leucobacter sp. 7(1)]|uniref:FecCD family ABC transporter permease n=1 Tax=Leucobacter sp. 7(1) TaxID=1255613 RepID=UPI00097F3685|nr:iron chelate uptake ABC transporter family permease subunit [Leucobacter sp. 7(1)]SJN12478.1 ABC-type Fe3+-siderophore transport system, permease 2 component [Leucobacter sp. 7(1)]
MSRLDFGRRVHRIRIRGIWLRWDVRTTLIGVALALSCILLAFLALVSGDYPLTLGEVRHALFSGVDDFTRTVVVEWRMPRIVAAIVFGAALGSSGAVFQSLTRNPLASPDILGFSAGAYTGALIVIIVLGGSYLQVAAGALIGGIGTAALVYLLAFRRGVQGFRLIIVGIAISAMLSSVNTWLTLTADLDTAMVAAVWGAGSLNGMTWQQTGIGSILVLLLLVATLVLARPLRQLELGDDAAQALGVRVEASRLILMLLSVGLIAVVTAAAGPVAFVALAAPQIARRLTRTPGVSVASAALMGAAMLIASDYLALHLLPAMLPVGTVTVVVGGAYLIWLLIHEARRLP